MLLLCYYHYIFNYSRIIAQLSLDYSKIADISLSD